MIHIYIYIRIYIYKCVCVCVRVWGKRITVRVNKIMVTATISGVPLSNSNEQNAERNLKGLIWKWIHSYPAMALTTKINIKNLNISAEASKAMQLRLCWEPGGAVKGAGGKAGGWFGWCQYCAWRKASWGHWPLEFWGNRSWSWTLKWILNACLILNH